MKKKSKKLKPRAIFILLILIIAIILLILKGVVFKKLTIKLNDKIKVSIGYSGLKFKEQKVENGFTKLVGKDQEIIVKPIGEVSQYGSYNNLKDYREMAYKAKTVTYNNKEYLCYSKKNYYEIVTQIDNNYYLEIQVVKKDESNLNLEEIFNQKTVQATLNKIKIH